MPSFQTSVVEYIDSEVTFPAVACGVAFERMIFCPSGLRGLAFRATCAGLVDFTASVTVTRLSNTTNGIQGNTNLIFAEGLYDQTQLSISGCINYEVIPNSTLIPNVKVDYSPNEPLTDLVATKSIISELAILGIGNIFTRSEYAKFSNHLKAELFERHFHYGHASFKGFF